MSTSGFKVNSLVKGCWITDHTETAGRRRCDSFGSRRMNRNWVDLQATILSDTHGPFDKTLPNNSMSAAIRRMTDISKS